MNLNRRTITLIQLFVALAALLLLAAGMSGLHFEPGRDLDLLGLLLGNLRPTATPPVAGMVGGVTFPAWLRIAFWLLLIFAVAYAVVSPEGRRRLFVTLILVVLILFIADRYRDRAPEKQPDKVVTENAGALPEGVAATMPEPPPFVTNPPAWLFWAVNGAAALALFLALWFLWRRLRPQPDAQSLLAAEAANALAALEAGGDLRDVVLRCYVQMNAVLKESQRIERRRAMTPREFEQHLAAAGLRDEHIHRLTRLFEGVRYGARRSTDQAAQEASQCLQAIVQTYGVQT